MDADSDDSKSVAVLAGKFEIKRGLLSRRDSDYVGAAAAAIEWWNPCESRTVTSDMSVETIIADK